MSAVHDQPAASRATPNRDDPQYVTALVRGLEILSAFREGGVLLGNQELARLTGLPRSTVSRLTHTLTAFGYLLYDDATRKYRAGVGLLGLGASIQRNLRVQNCARPFMQSLTRELGVTVAIGSRDRLGIVFLEIARPADTPRVVNTDAGTVLPLHNTAIGLAYLVGATLAERTSVLEELQLRHGASWPEVRAIIERAHADYHRRGFVVSLRSWSRAVNAVGVPLLLPGGQGVYAFNCASPSQDAPRKRLLEELGPRLVETVARIRVELERASPTMLVEPSVYQP
ncbi:MAG: IclR family transcriptional regulator [Burkholderiaceae bacterium]